MIVRVSKLCSGQHIQKLAQHRLSLGLTKDAVKTSVDTYLNAPRLQVETIALSLRCELEEFGIVQKPYRLVPRGNAHSSLACSKRIALCRIRRLLKQGRRVAVAERHLHGFRRKSVIETGHADQISIIGALLRNRNLVEEHALRRWILQILLARNFGCQFLES